MNRKQTLEMLRAARVFNDHGLVGVAADLAVRVSVYVRYRVQETGRAYQPAAWQVIRPGFRTDPNGYWRDYGHKTFNVYGREQKEAKRLEAIAWASERYDFDPEDWVPSPFGRASGWFPRPVLEAALDAIQRGARLSQKDGSVIPPTTGGKR